MEGGRYAGRIVGYDDESDYLAKITTKGLERIQKVKA
jgi:hypothetical protein